MQAPPPPEYDQEASRCAYWQAVFVHLQHLGFSQLVRFFPLDLVISGGWGGLGNLHRRFPVESLFVFYKCLTRGREEEGKQASNMITSLETK